MNSTIASRVTRVVAETLAYREDFVEPHHSFVADLGADSLDLLELVMALEEEFLCEISDEVAENSTTVQLAVAHIEAVEGAKRT